MFLKNFVNKVIDRIGLTTFVTILFGLIITGIVALHWFILETKPNLSEFMSNYACNIATECFGIVITIAFVKTIFDRFENKKEKNEECKKIIRQHRTVFLYMQSYLKHMHCIVTPIERRFKNGIKLETEFSLKDIQNLYTPTLLLTESSQQSSIKCFFEYELKLRDAFANMINNIDFKFYSNICKIIEDFVDISIAYDVRNVILDNEKMILTGTKQKLSEFYADMFKDDSIFERYKEYQNNELESNGILPYLMLYDMLKNEQKILLTYLDEIKKLIP